MTLNDVILSNDLALINQRLTFFIFGAKIYSISSCNGNGVVSLITGYYNYHSKKIPCLALRLQMKFLFFSDVRRNLINYHNDFLLRKTYMYKSMQMLKLL